MIEYKVKSYISLDIEANKGYDGLNEIIRISAIKVNDGFIVDKFDSYVKPRIHGKLNKKIKKLTNIKQEDIDKSKDLSLVLDEFMEFSENLHIITVSKNDAHFIYRNLEAYNLPLDDYKSIKERNLDVVEAYVYLTGNVAHGGLESMMIDMGLDFEGDKHNSIDDATNASVLFQKIIKEL